MGFPQESIDKARQIVESYNRTGRKSQVSKAVALNYGKFLETTYGFNDSIREGRCGHFLHEVKKDSDCFSRAGIDYIIAKEAGLKPKIFWASGMKDIKDGEDPRDVPSGEHAFITLVVNGDTWVSDPFYNKLGKVKIERDKMIIDNETETNSHSTQNITRWFDSLTELSEDEYVARLNANRGPEGGRLALSSGQIIINNNRRIYTQFFPETNQLTTSIHRGILTPFVQPSPSRDVCFSLTGAVSNGIWDTENGDVRVFYARSIGWLLEQTEVPHMNIEYSYKTAKEYISNLETAAKFYGRKTSIKNLAAEDLLMYFEKIGFSETGDLIKDNNVDKVAHSKLLDAIATELPKIAKENANAADFIHQKACYHAMRINNKRTDNPFGLLYSVDERKAVENEYLELVHAKYISMVESMYSTVLADAKLISNLKKHIKTFQILKNRADNSNIYRTTLDIRRGSKPSYDQQVDFAVFQKEHPVGSIHATDEQQLTYYKHISHNNLIYLSRFLPSLELKSFRNGIKKILR